MKNYFSPLAALALLLAVTACDKHKDNNNTPSEQKCPEGAVDLGVVLTRVDGTTYKLYWAKSNLCEDGLCANETDYGDFYAWGETVPYYTAGHSKDNPCSSWRDGKDEGYTWSSYKWCDGPLNKLTKYCTDASYGYMDFFDDITELHRGEYGKPIDDAAREKLDGKWRIPTYLEWMALLDQCECEWTTRNGKNGLLVTGNGNSIFLPAAGTRSEKELYHEGSYGYYWSATLNGDEPCYSWCLGFYDEGMDMTAGTLGRYYGETIRPVSE